MATLLRSLLCRDAKDKRAATEAASDNVNAAIAEKLVSVLTPEVKSDGNAIGNPIAETKLMGYFTEAVAKVMQTDDLKNKMAPDMAGVLNNFKQGDSISDLISAARTVQGKNIPLADTSIPSALGPLVTRIKDTSSGSSLTDILSTLTSSHKEKSKTATAILGALGGGALNGNLPGGLNTFSQLLPYLPQVTDHLPNFLKSAFSL